MKYKLITIAGYSCAGKSTIIQELQKFYNCEIIKFGEIHKECVRENGYNYAKDWIRECGFEEYEMALVKCFIRRLKGIENTDGIVIIDGIFSEKCFNFMRGMDSFELINIVLNTDYDVRVKRMMTRQKLGFEDAVKHLETTDGIKRRAGLAQIVEQPTYEINGNMSVQEIKERCIYIIAQLSAGERDVTRNKNVLIEKEEEQRDKE